MHWRVGVTWVVGGERAGKGNEGFVGRSHVRTVCD